MHLRVLPATVAVIVAEPFLSAVTLPAFDTVAIDFLDDLKAALAVVPVTLRAAVLPDLRLSDVLLRATFAGVVGA